MKKNTNIVVKAIEDGVSLDTVFVRDFDDGYHSDNLYEGDELYQEARKIRRRYRSFSEFYHAQAVFGEYMERLYEKHGGMEMVKMLYETDTLEDFIPPIPRMRDTKENRRIMELGITVSVARETRPKIDFDEVDEFMEERLEYSKPTIVFDGEYITEEEHKMMTRSTTKLSTKDIGGMNGLNIITQYLDRQNQKKAMDKSYYDDEEDSFYEEILGIAEEEQEDLTQMTNYKGRAMTLGDKKTLELIELLGQHGWNGTKLLRNMRGGNSTDRLYGIAKDMKKTKKKQEKLRKKRMRAQGISDDFMKSIYGDGFGEYQDDILDMTGRNLFG